jgi:hypothetical protein
MGIEDVRRPDVVLPVRVDPAGVDGPTPKAARGPHWRRSSRGWYLPSSVSADRTDQRIVEAMAGMPDDAAVTGWAALAWGRGRWFNGIASDGDTPLPVPVALGDQRSASPPAGVRLSEDWLFPDDVMVVDGLRITVPNRSVTYETRRARRLALAVRVIDMAAYDDLIDLEDLAAYVDRLVARQGIKLTRLAVPMAVENAWSPTECDMRIAWKAAVPAALLCNAPLFDRHGQHLFTPDLFDPIAAVAGEYNGRVHVEDGARSRDVDKDAAYRQHGIELVQMISTDRHDTTRFENRLVAAYRRAAERQPSATWTLDQPDWWVDTSTVARRRALSAEGRSIWLRYRGG